MSRDLVYVVSALGAVLLSALSLGLSIWIRHKRLRRILADLKKPLSASQTTDLEN